MSRLLAFVLDQKWAMDGEYLRKCAGLLRAHSLGKVVDASEVRAVVRDRDAARAGAGLGGGSGDRGYWIDSRGVAIVPIEGVLCRRASLVSDISLPAGMAADQVVSAVSGAASDSAAKSVVLSFDSPGGTVAGTEEMVDAVRGAKARKPVVAWVASRMASGAYWIGSQADSIVCGRMASAGSIGVYQVVEDSSKAYSATGVVVHVLRAGEFKGIGVEGAAVTPAQLAVLQAEVAAIYELFIDDVSKGRGLSRAQALQLADGRSHVGHEAVALGLVDEVGPLDRASELAVSLVGKARTAGPAAVASGNRGAAKFEDRIVEIVAQSGKTTNEAVYEACQRFPKEHTDWIKRRCPAIVIPDEAVQRGRNARAAAAPSYSGEKFESMVYHRIRVCPETVAVATERLQMEHPDAYADYVRRGSPPISWR